ncbi:MAG: hypothetical protein IPN04_12975 [Rhodoferax sp.]|nr:hypothetical protein [Rhodoferax sp.]
MHFVPTDAWVEHDSGCLTASYPIWSTTPSNTRPQAAYGWPGVRHVVDLKYAIAALGISKEDQATIFNEFAQVNNPARNNEAGLGLGLLHR